MNHDRFDLVARRLSTAVSRRAALSAGLAALLPLSPGTGTQIAAQRRRQPKQCGPCERHKGTRKCKPAPDDKRCNGDGRCLRGQCNQPPACIGAAFDIPCVENANCCSGFCNVFCSRSGAGQRCFVDGDCVSDRCDGYRCRA